MRLRTLLITIAVAISAFISYTVTAQPLLVENFEYAEGSTLVANGWTAHSGSGTNSLTVVSPGLSYLGYEGSDIGLSVGMVKSGEDVNKTFAGQTSGSVYAAFLVNISDAGANEGDYFIHFMKDNTTDFRGRVFVQKHATEPKIRFGINRGSNATSVNWTDYVYDLNTTLLLVLKYEFVTGDKNDICSLFINPTIGSAEPVANIVNPTETNNDLATLNAIALRQGKTENGSILTLDALRVATTWDEAVKQSSGEDLQPPVATFFPDNEATNVSVNVVPTITFNEPIFNTDGSDIENSDLGSLISFEDAYGDAFGFDATINSEKTVITVTPTASLLEGTSYTLTISSVKDEAGNQSNEQNTSFTTISTLPVITIISPLNNATFTTQDVLITFEVDNFNIGAPDTGSDGHIVYTLDTEIPVSQNSNQPILLTNLALGSHTVTIELVDNSGTQLVPAVSASVTFTIFESPTGELFFSEYIEGSSNNKAIEIYNPNSFPVNLSDYSVKLYPNGAAVANNTLTMTGSLVAKGVYVIANSQAAEAILNVSNTTSNVTAFNGNDALGLYKNDVLIDVFGIIGNNPGDGWSVAGVSNATLDHTLVRKPHVIQGNTNWVAQAGNNEDDSEWIVYPKDTFNHLGNHQAELNDQTDFLSFSLTQQTGSATINTIDHTINIEIVNGTSLESLIPTFSLSAGATASIGGVSQTSGVSVVDFTSPVTYSVVAQNGINTQNWIVTVTISTTQSSEAEILTFSIPEQANTPIISTTNATVQITVFPGTNVTALVPTITISYGATINPVSGVAQDFTNPVVYTVTAQNGTIKEWTVTVSFQELTTIHQIQYTTNPNGNSPYNNQTVSTSGIVTAIHGSVGFYLQDGTGLWNGLYIFRNTQPIPLPAIGDSVIVRGKIVEYYNLTEMKDLVFVTVKATNKPLPAPLEVSANQLTEGTEGILVHAANYRCVHDGTGNHQTSMYIRPEAPNDTLKVFCQIYTDFLPYVGKRYNFTGVVSFDFGEFKIAPRNSADVYEVEENIAPIITDIAIYPEIPVTGEEIYVQSTITDDGGQSNLLKQFFYGFDEEEITTELSLLPIGVSGTRFLATIPAQSTATPVYFRIVANDGELETEYIGGFDIATGIETNNVSLISVYPNPTTNKLYVNVEDDAHYIILNVTGQNIGAGNLTAGQNEINVTNFSQSLYIINVISSNGKYRTASFIKQ